MVEKQLITTVSSELFSLQVFLVLIFILAVIIYRTLAAIWLFKDPTTKDFAPLLASTSGAMVGNNRKTLAADRSSTFNFFLKIFPSFVVLLLDLFCTFHIQIYNIFTR